VRLSLPALVLLVATPTPIHAPTPARPARVVSDPPALITVELDSSYSQVVVTVGPFRVPAGMATDDADPMAMAMMQDSCIGQFVWPRAALFHGLRLELLDAHGAALPRSLLHHLRLNNFDRRDLIYPQMEHLVAFGHETENISVPATIGLPMTRGHHVAVVAMWNNVSGHDLESVRLRLTFKLNHRRQSPAPIAVLPFVVNASPLASGMFDVPPGGVTRDLEFTVPLSGRLLVVGGHLHDQGAWMRLEDAATGREIVTVRPLKDRGGRVVRMSRVLALLSRGPHLRAGRLYRLKVRYENATNDTLVGMGIMGGLFSPDDMRAWPAIDPSDPHYPDYPADICGVRRPL
jgi:hypothetical protein